MNLPSVMLLLQSIVGGLFTGAIYGLLGVGLTLSWGLLRQINLAHFAFATSSAYLTYELGTRGVDPLLALLFMPPLFFAIGAGMQVVMSRFRASPFNSLLITFGLTTIIEAALQWIWTADPRQLESKYAGSKLHVGGLFLPTPELITLFLSVLIALTVWLGFRRSDIGKAIRAAAQDAAIAAAFGINQRALSVGVAGLCAALAGVAGVCIALTYTLAPSQIYSWIGVVFACVIVGGLGRPLGPLIAGCLIGIAEAVTMTITAPAWAPLASFSLLMVALLARPGRA